jgi:hypothetical protein
MNTTLTEEQKTARLGRFTGSEIHKLMGAKGFGKTGETYIIEKVAEFLTGEPTKQEFSSAATSWGIEHEMEARDYFEAATGLKVINSTTIDNGFIAGTPDGILENCIGFEIKCPFNSGNHIKNLMMSNAVDLLELRSEYYWQVVSYMWLTGFNDWKFCSYDPRFKEEKRMLILNVKLITEHLELLKKRVTEAKLMFDNIISKLK